jgi:succinate-acetate transporter protein
VTVITGLTYVGLPLGVLMAAIGFQRMEHEVEVGLSLTLIGLATAVMSVVLGRALSSARPWARHFVLWVYPVTLAMEIALGDNGVIEQGFSWWRFIAALAVYTASAFVLMRPDARAFFGKRQQTPAASV